MHLAPAVWFEKCNAGDPDDKLRTFNGFVHLELNGPDLTEIFYDELGRVAWQPGTQDTAVPRSPSPRDWIFPPQQTSLSEFNSR
jgi:hypothetical protein